MESLSAKLRLNVSCQKRGVKKKGKETEKTTRKVSRGEDKRDKRRIANGSKGLRVAWFRWKRAVNLRSLEKRKTRQENKKTRKKKKRKREIGITDAAEGQPCVVFG